MKTSIVVGMGIGQLYKDVLESLDHQVITVDPDPTKGAMWSSVDSAILMHGKFDTAHICTPNFTHFELAAKVAPISKIVFIEKPGVASSQTWHTLCKTFPYTRFIMVKNNMWRDNILDLQQQAAACKSIDIMWLNKNRVPNAGTWFTTKKLAFGGVSRDLMPHLLSLYVAMNPNWRTDVKTSAGVRQNWVLDQLVNSDYGQVKKDGVYDVDDECYMSFTDKWNLVANWRTNDYDSRGILFQTAQGQLDTFDLGLCPESAYCAMIKQCLNNIDNDAFWKNQHEIDSWIHAQIENL